MSKKSIVLTIVALVVVIGGAVAYVALSRQAPQPTQPSQNQQSQQENKPAETETQPNTAKPGTYATYETASFEGTTGRRVLFFHAAWCPQCRALEKSILEGQIPSGMTIFKVNYDTSQDLRLKYGVARQTTIVEVDANGKETKKFDAYFEPTLAAVLKALGN